jgi:hypothetical protein
MSKARCTAAGDSISTCTGKAPRPQRPAQTPPAAHRPRLDLGHHQVARRWPAAGTRNGGHVGIKMRVVHRVHTHRHAGCSGWATQRQFHHQRGMLGLAAHGGAVFAVQRDIENAGTELSVISACSCRLLRMRASTPL